MISNHRFKWQFAYHLSEVLKTFSASAISGSRCDSTAAFCIQKMVV